MTKTPVAAVMAPVTAPVTGPSQASAARGTASLRAARPDTA